MLSRKDLIGIQEFGEKIQNTICDISEYNAKEIEDFLLKKIGSGQHLKDLRTIIKNNLKQDLEFKVQLTSENGETYSSGLQIVSTKELLESQSSLIKLALKNPRIRYSKTSSQISMYRF